MGLIVGWLCQFLVRGSGDFGGGCLLRCHVTGLRAMVASGICKDEGEEQLRCASVASRAVCAWVYMCTGETEEVSLCRGLMGGWVGGWLYVCVSFGGG